MLIDKETLRLIFGLKLRSLREEKKFSLKDLAKKTGLSPSYLNEIEKGKKYPKTEKIIILANALDEKYENLISLELKKELQLVKKLLDKNVLKTLPLDVFGIPTNTLFELIANEPEKMSAFVGTILEIARAHNIQIDDIFFALLRSYIDMHGNYFPEIEKKAEEIREKFSIDINADPEQLASSLEKILTHDFKVKIIEEELQIAGAKLNKILYYIKDEGKKLFISNEINIKEKIFILTREIGYRTQKLDHRPISSLIIQLDSFEQLYNHFMASYFASSLLIPNKQLINNLEAIFQNPKANMVEIEGLVKKYNAPIESVFHRITQILPSHFNINHLFFLRYEFDSKNERYEIARELHLSSLHGPHRIKGSEHYCARWLISHLTNSMIQNDMDIKMGMQRSHFVDNKNEYLIIAGSFKNQINKNKTTSVCLGLLINSHLTDQISMLKNNSIPNVDVGETCERCSITNCKDRKAPHEVPLELLLTLEQL